MKLIEIYIFLLIFCADYEYCVSLARFNVLLYQILQQKPEKKVEIQVFGASIRPNFDVLLLFPLIFLYHYVALQILYPTLYRQIFLRFFIIVKKRLKAIEV